MLGEQMADPRLVFRSHAANIHQHKESVTPCSNQQIAPALIPASTMPDAHASRSSSSNPHSRQTASMLLVFPPPT
jgi:hypothetical protein